MSGGATTPWAWSRVIKAATELSSGQKLVWLEIQGMDQGADRAYIGAINLGRRIGMGCENVEKARRELKRAGLLGTAPRPGKREPSWWPILPAECRPSSSRPSDDEVLKLAALLDDLIRSSQVHRGADRGTPLQPQNSQAGGVLEGGPPPNRKGVPQSASPTLRCGALQSASEGGEVGGEGGTSPLQKVGTTHPSSPPPSEEGEEGGVFASELEEVGTGQGTPLGKSWRDILEKPSGSSQPTQLGVMLRRSAP